MTEPSNAVDSGGAGDSLPASYEQARAELEEVVRRLEAGGVPLEESLVLWERGEVLGRRCEQWLDGARRRVEQPSGRSAEDEGAPPR